MKNQLYSLFQRLRHQTAAATISLAFGLIAWFFPLTPISVLAETPSPVMPFETTNLELPDEEVGELPDFDCLPLYQIPLALNPHDHFYFTRPIAVDSNTDPSPDFRYGYKYPGENKVHTGVDIISPMYKPVLAAGDGTVIFTGYGLMNGGGDIDDPYGMAILIRHDFRYQEKTLYTVYAHLDSINVEPDQTVYAGDQIGTIGMTGNTSGPHLHFEVRIEDNESGRVQNPELWMAPPIGSGVLAGQLKDNYGYLISVQELKIKSLDSDNSFSINTYASDKSVHFDDYFKENFVLGDIPAGSYELSMLYKNRWYRLNITIAPGTVNFVYFNSKNGFSQVPPSSPDPDEFLN